MAIPVILGKLYRTVASYGVKQARKLSPRYMGAASKAYGKKIGNTTAGQKISGFTSKQFGKLPVEGKGVFTQEKVKKFGKGVANKYGKVYSATLGTSNRRKVTSAALGGYMLGSIFDDE